VLEQRLEFCRLVEAGGVPFAELCRRFGVKRDTGYKWWARWLEEGDAGLVDRPRTPRGSPARTGEEMEGLVCGVREKHLAWGWRETANSQVRAYGNLSGGTRSGRFRNAAPPSKQPTMCAVQRGASTAQSLRLP